MSSLSTALANFGCVIDDLIGDDEADAASKSIKQLLQVFSDNRSFARGQQFGLYDGILAGGDKSEFRKRLEDRREEKIALGESCVTHKESCLTSILATYEKVLIKLGAIGMRRTKLFFESGSTIAYILGAFAKQLRGIRAKHSSLEQPPMTVVTNNFIGLTALAGFVDQVVPIHGRLDLKYYGFFPFSESLKEPHELEIDDDSQIHSEIRAFDSISDEINNTDFVFATCSSFSFLFGPMVGSRANCMTKSAMSHGASRWNQDVGKRYYMCFDFAKLCPVIEEHAARAKFSLETPKGCRCVFDFTHRDVIKGWYAGQVDDEETANTTFHWNATMGTAPPSVSFREFEESCRARGIEFARPIYSWIDWIGRVRDVYVVIALPAGKADIASLVIEKEVRALNSLLELLRKSRKAVVIRRDDVAYVRIIEKQRT